jgi:hypothetical protein
LRVITPDASTTRDAEATRGPDWRSRARTMVRVFLIVLAAGLIALAAGVVYLGAFPPVPHVQTVDKVVPNDTFKSQ